MVELAFSSATEQARLVRSRDVSPVELVTAYLGRIEVLDGELNSYITVLADRALEEARSAEAAVVSADELGPFHGVPISIKELNDTAGIKTTYSCRGFADHVPDADCSTVRRIKEAGFIVLGKTNAPELGTLPATESYLNGTCRNPWNTGLTPGGSSGGAGAALAAGLCPISQGSDGGGSIRIPASCCGLFGIKPARGRVSRAPWASLADLATDGPIARTVEDAAALLDVIAGYEVGDPYWLPDPARPFVDEVGAAPGGLKIAVTFDNPIGAPLDPNCRAAAEDAAALLESLGHTIEEATPPWDDPEAMMHFTTVWQCIPAAAGDPDPASLEPINRLFSELARQTPSSQLVAAAMWLQGFARRIVGFWDDYDLLLSPTLCLPPVPIGWFFDENEDPAARFFRTGLFTPITPIANLTGQPAVSLPTYWTDDGIPIGVQLMGRPADEATLFRISAQVEAARPWVDRRPVVS
jgi:amidase